MKKLLLTTLALAVLLAVPAMAQVMFEDPTGDEFLLGETTLDLLSSLSAWPSPYRGGDLQISFATFGGLGGGAGPAEVVLYSVSGRRVRTIVNDDFAAGVHRATS